MSKPDTHHAAEPRPLLARILDTPQLARIVPALPAEVLHRVIERCGLEDCGELVGLATPAQLSAVFDLDLWRTDQPGVDAEFSAERFGEWLEVLVAQGDEKAARTVAGLDVHLVTAALAQHVGVFDPAAVEPSVDPELDELQPDQTPDTGLTCRVGGYLVSARTNDTWDAIVAVLTSLDADHPEFFHTLMRGCRALSNSAPEVDGLDNLLTVPDQVLFDLDTGRERRRERLGFATPAEARAFLQAARAPLAGQAGVAQGDPIAAAYFRSLGELAEEPSADANTAPPSAIAAATSTDPAPALAALVDVLVAEGVLPRPPAALLDSPQGPSQRFACIRGLMRVVHDRNPAAYLTRSQELAFLANTLMAGGSVQERTFSQQEASDAAVAVCNLALEHPLEAWLAPPPPGTRTSAVPTLPEDFLVGHDLVRVFQVGWSLLHREACMKTAAELVDVLKHLVCDDRETRADVRQLRIELQKQWRAGEPWRARGSFDVLTSLDMSAWAALLGLIAECPVLHAALGASRGTGARHVSATAFEFISERSQLAAVRAFMSALPTTLSS